MRTIALVGIIIALQAISERHLEGNGRRDAAGSRWVLTAVHGVLRFMAEPCLLWYVWRGGKSLKP